MFTAIASMVASELAIHVLGAAYTKITTPAPKNNRSFWWTKRTVATSLGFRDNIELFVFIVTIFIAIYILYKIYKLLFKKKKK